MALRMKNSLSSSIWLARRRNGPGSQPFRSGFSSARRDDRRIQSGSVAHRSRTDPTDGSAARMVPTTSPARASTRAHVRDSRIRPLQDGQVSGADELRMEVEHDRRHPALEDGRVHRAVTSATSSS